MKRFLGLLVFFFLGVGVLVAQPADSDNDGIPDLRDTCPREAGPISNSGCPLPTPIPTDSDGDGFLDTVDACPTLLGGGITSAGESTASPAQKCWT